MNKPTKPVIKAIILSENFFIQSEHQNYIINDRIFQILGFKVFFQLLFSSLWRNKES